jgi:hypothetical protein
MAETLVVDDAKVMSKQNSAIYAMKKFQAQMDGIAKQTGFQSEDDIDEKMVEGIEDGVDDYLGIE